MQASQPEVWHGTTILTVRKGGKVVIGVRVHYGVQGLALSITHISTTATSAAESAAMAGKP